VQAPTARINPRTSSDSTAYVTSDKMFWHCNGLLSYRVVGRHRLVLRCQSITSCRWRAGREVTCQKYWSRWHDNKGVTNLLQLWQPKPSQLGPDSRQLTFLTSDIKRDQHQKPARKPHYVYSYGTVWRQSRLVNNTRDRWASSSQAVENRSITAASDTLYTRLSYQAVDHCYRGEVGLSYVWPQCL